MGARTHVQSIPNLDALAGKNPADSRTCGKGYRSRSADHFLHWAFFRRWYGIAELQQLPS
jgi:hypothetical protein